MNVKYSDRVKQGGGALLDQAAAVLEEVVGEAAGRVRAEWDQAENGRGRPAYTLRLTDGPEEVTTTFAAEELRAPRELRYRLIRLWGDLLEKRSHRQLKELVSASDEAGG
jgi:hypothetical protein